MDAGRGVSWVALLWPADNLWPPEVDFGGAVWATTSNPHVSSQPMALDLQTQAWACLPNRWEQCADGSTPAEVDLHVDWVSAYTRPG